MFNYCIFVTQSFQAIKVANKAKLKRKLLAKSKTALTTIQTEIAIMKKMVIYSLSSP